MSDSREPVFDTVVVPAELGPEGNRAVAIGAVLARQGGATVELVHVLPIDADVAPIAAELAHLAATVTGVAVAERCVSSEQPVDAIVSLAGEGRLLCLASAERSAAGQFVHGSVSAAVCRSTTSPVMLVGPEVRPGALDEVRTVVVCLDGSDHAAELVPLAGRLGAQLGADVRLLLVETLAATGLPSDHDPAGYLAGQAERLELDPATVRQVVLRGSIAREITEHVRVLGPGTLLLAATHGRTGLARMVMGSIVAEVVRTAPAPVLVLPSHPA